MKLSTKPFKVAPSCRLLRFLRRWDRYRQRLRLREWHRQEERHSCQLPRSAVGSVNMGKADMENRER